MADIEKIRDYYTSSITLAKELTRIQKEQNLARFNFGSSLVSYIKELRAQGHTKKQAFDIVKSEFALTDFEVSNQWMYFHNSI